MINYRGHLLNSDELKSNSFSESSLAQFLKSNFADRGNVSMVLSQLICPLWPQSWLLLKQVQRKRPRLLCINMEMSSEAAIWCPSQCTAAFMDIYLITSSTKQINAAVWQRQTAPYDTNPFLAATCSWKPRCKRAVWMWEGCLRGVIVLWAWELYWYIT